MINADDTILENAEYLAGLLYTNQEIAELLEVDADQLEHEIARKSSEIANRILTGRATRQAALRESILDMACRGSSPAQSMAMELNKKLS